MLDVRQRGGALNQTATPTAEAPAPKTTKAPASALLAAVEIPLVELELLEERVFLTGETSRVVRRLLVRYPL